MRRDLGYIDAYLKQGLVLSPADAKLVETLRKVHEQQRYMLENRTHKVPGRIVSISQPMVRPIVRGKVRTPTEFGSKIQLSNSDGFLRVDYMSYDAFNESTLLIV